MSVVVVLVVLLFSFPVDGVGVPVHLFFVVCYCFLFWIGCVLSSSATMKLDHLCSVVSEYCGVRKRMKLYYLQFFCEAVAGFFVQ